MEKSCGWRNFLHNGITIIAVDALVNNSSATLTFVYIRHQEAHVYRAIVGKDGGALMGHATNLGRKIKFQIHTTESGDVLAMIETAPGMDDPRVNMEQNGTYRTWDLLGQYWTLRRWDQLMLQTTARFDYSNEDFEFPTTLCLGYDNGLWEVKYGHLFETAGTDQTGDEVARSDSSNRGKSVKFADTKDAKSKGAALCSIKFQERDGESKDKPVNYEDLMKDKNARVGFTVITWEKSMHFKQEGNFRIVENDDGHPVTFMPQRCPALYRLSDFEPVCIYLRTENSIVFGEIEVDYSSTNLRANFMDTRIVVGHARRMSDTEAWITEFTVPDTWMLNMQPIPEQKTFLVGLAAFGAWENENVCVLINRNTFHDTSGSDHATTSKDPEEWDRWDEKTWGVNGDMKALYTAEQDAIDFMFQRQAEQRIRVDVELQKF